MKYWLQQAGWADPGHFPPPPSPRLASGHALSSAIQKQLVKTVWELMLKPQVLWNFGPQESGEKSGHTQYTLSEFLVDVTHNISRGCVHDMRS